MSDDHIHHQRPLEKGKRAAPSVPDERDATIVRLQRTVEDERQRSAALRDTVESLRFKTDVLEKSYAKQLADARLRSEAAEQALAEHRARVAELDSDRENTARILSETQAELERVSIERDPARKQSARRPGAGARTKIGRSAEDSGLTINELLSAAWLEKPPKSDEDSHRSALVAAAPEAPPEDMIAPELVFTRGRADDDET